MMPDLGSPTHVILRCNACHGLCEVPWQLNQVQIARCRACIAEARVAEMQTDIDHRLMSEGAPYDLGTIRSAFEGHRAQGLHADPRSVESIEMLMELVVWHQQKLAEVRAISKHYTESTDPLLDKLETLSDDNSELRALLKDCRLLIADQAWGCATYFIASYDGKEVAVVQKLLAAFLTHWNPAYPGASFTSIPPKYTPIAPDQLPAWVPR
jgi:hypothetical protein